MDFTLKLVFSNFRLKKASKHIVKDMMNNKSFFIKNNNPPISIYNDSS